MDCPSCSKESREGAKVCGFCGTRFDAPDGRTEALGNEIGQESESGGVSDGAPVNQRPSIGVALANNSKQLAKKFNLPSKEGVVVTGVTEASAAEAAGLSKGDVILEINGVAVSKAGEITQAVRSSEVGDAIELSVFRPVAKVSVEITARETGGES